MSCFQIVVCILVLLAQEPSATQESFATQGSTVTKESSVKSGDSPRSLANIHKHVRAQEKAVARSKTDEEKSKTISTLCALFVEIGQHPDLPDSQTLQSLSVRLRSRLAGIEKRTTDELRKRKIPEPQIMIDESKAFRRSRYLASRGIPNQNAGQADASTSNNSVNQSKGTGASNASARGSTGSGSSEESSEAAGNSGTLAGNSAPGGLPDFGWGLVDLIRKTIRPDYWAVSGGPGNAIYFGPSRAIVIHGSWTVQEDVAELLTALRGG